VWVSHDAPPAEGYHRDRAYYLQWGADQAYAIELVSDAQLFFTAELTGCGILIFTAPKRTIVVHHNIQVTPVPPDFVSAAFRECCRAPTEERRHAAAL